MNELRLEERQPQHEISSRSRPSSFNAAHLRKSHAGESAWQACSSSTVISNVSLLTQCRASGNSAKVRVLREENALRSALKRARERGGCGGERSGAQEGVSARICPQTRSTHS